MRSFAALRGARIGWFLSVAVCASPAVAAPFCIQSEAVPPQCNYYDAHQCQQEAARQGGICSVNPQQLTLQPGIGQYCMVTSEGVSLCNYADMSTCQKAAARQDAACTEAPNVAPARSPNPYAPVGGL